jgi:RHS repeat-associated protein
MKILVPQVLKEMSQAISNCRLPRRFGRQCISLILVMTLITNPLLAAPEGFISLGHQMNYSASFWWYNSGLAAKTAKWFKQGQQNTPKGWDGKGAAPNTRPEPKEPEKQSDRDFKVQRIEISPGDVTIQTGEKIIFSAIAYDVRGNMVPGVKFTWDGSDENKNRKMSVTQRGEFYSPVAGKYKVTVEALGKRDSVNVEVVGEQVNPKDPGKQVETVSSHDAPKPEKSDKIGFLRASPNVPKDAISLRQKWSDKWAKLSDRTMHAAAPSVAVMQSGYDYYQWNAGNYTTADDPGREVGQMPGHAADGGAGSGNFQFSAPLLALDGRGIDVNLGMNYNSRLWHKVNSDMYFDVDNNYIPGWSFGFGKIITAGSGFMLIDADGTRHSYGGNVWNYSSPNTSLQGFDGYTKDGTFINYYARGYKPQFNSTILEAWAKLPNGTKIVYGASTKLTAYPTQITDANGNYITITYRSNQGPNIDTITDTLGRQIKFKYANFNGKEVVVAVTAPGFNAGSDRVIAQFAYDTRDLSLAGTNYGFSGVTPRVQNSVVTVMKAVFYPATNTGYWFGDSDSYSNYGMIRKISERFNMACSNPNDTTAQANITGTGYVGREMVYAHTSLAGYSSIPGPLSDVPTYNQMTEDWGGRQSGIPKAVTEYSVSAGVTRITRGTTDLMDGLTAEQIIDNNSASQTYGLLLENKLFANKAATTPLRKSKTYWEVPDLNTYPSHYGAPRPNHTEVTDERTQVTTTNYSYGLNYNQVADVSEYGWSGALIRRTHTDYINTQAYNGYWSNNPYGSYFGRHIYSLVSSVDVYGPDNSTRASRTEYQYDQHLGQALINTPSVPQHELSHDPYDPGNTYCDWVWNDLTSSWEYVCNTYYTYDAGTDYRGNITTVKRYADAQNYSSDPNVIVETRYHDICGNVRIASTACCNQISYDYTSVTAYAWPSSVTRGDAATPANRNITSTDYDIYTGLVNSTTDANGRISSTVYNSATLRPIYEYSPTGGYVYHEYYENSSLLVIDFVYEAGSSTYNWASRVDNWLDGRGRQVSEISFTAGYEMDAVDTVYDSFSRIQKQTRPYRMNTSWQLVGTKDWANYSYDPLDRISSVVAPDGSTSYRYYNESTYPGVATAGALGNTVRVIDAWNRERWARSDEQNRIVEVVEPDPAGNGSLTTGGYKTNYAYNALGNLTSVTQGAQTRSFKYDSLGRLTNQKLAERDATLNDSGGAGSTWGDYFKYDNRGNLIQRVDARRVITNFNHGSDPLNRLQSVSYDKTSAINAANIFDAATVTYKYETTTGKDKTRLVGIELGTPNNNTTDFGELSFGYDSEGRMSSRTQNYGSSRSATVSYEFDTLDRVSKTYYPAASGGAIRQAVPTYDLASRFSTLTYNGIAMVTNPIYNASSQTTQLNLGNTTQEQYTYDPQTGFLTQQKVIQGGTNRADLSYDYGNLYTGGNATWKTGQLSKIIDNNNTNRNRQYKYDRLGRLIEAKGGATFALWTQTYNYDQFGNRTTQSASGTAANGSAINSDGSGNLTFNTATNRITSANFAYDAAGNQTQSDENGQVQSYRYDAAGRLVEVTNGAGVHTYAYGLNNQRLQMVEAGALGGTTLYAWDGESVIAEYDGAGNGMVWTKSYVYLGARLLATDSAANGTQYYHPDRLGTRLVTNTSGAVVSENIGLPFGAMITGESNNLAGSASKRRFTSYDRSDTTKLDYAVNRHYSSAQGRFAQVDPIGMSSIDLANPQSLNLYSYCLNDPVNYIDPSGLLAFLPAVAAGGEAGGPVGAIVVAAVLAVVSALRLLFGGRAQTRMVGQISNRLAQIETGDKGSWADSLIWPGVGAVAALLQTPSAPSRKILLEQKKDLCPPEKRRFFDWLAVPLGKLAQELDTTRELLLAHAAKEAGWQNADLDHNQPLNNPFGVNTINNKGQAAGNKKYDSLDAALGYWKGRFGSRVKGTRTPEDYVDKIQHPAPGQGPPYNTASKDKYPGQYKAVYDLLIKFEKICGIK